MDWIQTFSGKQFFPLQPRPQDIDIRDIAHALSLNCRFNGHCLTFYSVGEHSVRVSHLLPDRRLALWGLLHDAAEAYLTDLPRPVKRQIPIFRTIEDDLLKVIIQHFGLQFPMPPEVAEADDVMLATEQRDLMAPPPANWALRAIPDHKRIQTMTSTQARDAFLARFAELQSA